jgi:hypothetical protein
MTKISRKQVNVLFSNWKRGTLELEKSFCKFLYEQARNQELGIINHSQNLFDNTIDLARDMIDLIFKNQINEAQKLYNESPFK